MAEQKIAEQAYKEGQKEMSRTAKLAAALSMTENLEKLNKKLEATNRRLQEEPNVVQLGAGLGTMGLGAVGGAFTNQALRKYTRNWVDEKGERKTSAKLMSDVAPPFVGGLAGIAGAFSSNGMVAATMMGGGFGFAIGSVVSTLITQPPPPEVEVTV